MLKLHPEVIVKNGRKVVVLTYEEFTALKERLANAEDLIDLRKAKRAEGRKKSVPLAKAKQRLGVG